MGAKGARVRKADRKLKDAVDALGRWALESLEPRMHLTATINGEQNIYVPAMHSLVKVGSFLTAPSSAPAGQIAMNYLSAHVADLGIDAADLTNSTLTRQYTDPTSGTTHLYLSQTYNSLPIFNAYINVNVAKDGRVINVGSTFLDLDNGAALAPTPSIDAVSALGSIARSLNISMSSPASIVTPSAGADQHTLLMSAEASRNPIPASLQYTPTSDGLMLTWTLALRTSDGAHWYDATVDANSGAVVQLHDRASHATYNVFARPTENPDDGPRAIVTDPHDPAASPFGWHDTNGVAGAEFTDTRGNNVSAQEDIDGNDIGGFRPDGGAILNFNSPIDLTQEPANYTAAAVTNLFYWVNIAHDIHYKYGFTEAAGNFQVNNYGKGGLGNDAVVADAQDGSDTNNAVFFFTPDGEAPLIQMYLWDLNFNDGSTITPKRDGDFDSQVIIHEYGHGVSTRLAGGPNDPFSLSNLQSGGMGEGWGDFWGLMFTQKDTDLIDQPYPIGNYIQAQLPTDDGFRRYPYSFDMTIDPLTFDAYGLGGTANGVIRSVEVHDTGEIWASTLWDMNWLLINKWGFNPDISVGYTPGAAGNILALQLVMDGLKLVSAQPSFTEARDGILQADLALTGGANQEQIWEAFARRGLGLSAEVGDSNNIFITTAYDKPLFGAIKGIAWSDNDADGIHDFTELPVTGATVKLFAAGSDPANPAAVLATTVTNAQGAYAFERPADGNYFVQVIPAAGYIYTLQDQGGDETLDSDVSQTNGVSDVVTITVNSAPFVIDAGLIPTFITLGDLVFNDLDADGIQELGDFGLDGITVSLFNAGPDGLQFTFDDVLIAQEQTIGGVYQFDFLDATGSSPAVTQYYVHFLRPAGFSFSPKDATNDAKDSDVDPFVSTTDLFPLALNQRKTDVDAGMHRPTVTIDDVTVFEGNSGFTPAVFTLHMSEPSDVPVTFLFHTVDASAVAGQDYIGVPLDDANLPTGSVTFAPGQTTQTITIDIIGDTRLEADEVFMLRLILPTPAEAVLIDSLAQCTILNDEGIGVRIVGDAIGTEHPNGSVAIFTIALDIPHSQVVTVHYATRDGTARALSASNQNDADYVATSGDLTFLPGERTKTVVVPILSDLVNEGAESFFLDLSAAHNSVIPVGSGTKQGTIGDLPVNSFAFGGDSKGRYVDNSGNVVTVALIGPGIGTLMFLGAGASDGVAILVDGTTESSQLIIKTNKGQTSFVKIEAKTPLGAVIGKSSNLLPLSSVDVTQDAGLSQSNFIATGGVRNIQLNYIAAGNNFSIGGGPSAAISSVTLTLGRVVDLEMTSSSSIKTLRVASSNTVDTTGTLHTITAPEIGTITSRGNFTSSLNVSDSIGGITIDGVLQGSQIRAGGAIGTISARAMLNSLVFAGVKSTVTALPATAADFANAGAVLRGVFLRGKTQGVFANSLIGAPRIDTLSLGSIATVSTTVPARQFGVSADSIGSAKGRVGSQSFAFSRLDIPIVAYQQDDFIIRVV